MRALPFSALERLRGLALPPPDSSISGTVTFDPEVGPARYLARRIEGAGTELGAIVVAASARTPLGDPGLLAQSMLLIAPVILGGAILVGWLLAGRSLRPLGEMTEELEAITDEPGLRTLARRALAVARSLR